MQRWPRLLIATAWGFRVLAGLAGANSWLHAYAPQIPKAHVLGCWSSPLCWTAWHAACRKKPWCGCQLPLLIRAVDDRSSGGKSHAVLSAAQRRAGAGMHTGCSLPVPYSKSAWTGHGAAGGGPDRYDTVKLVGARRRPEPQQQLRLFHAQLPTRRIPRPPGQRQLQTHGAVTSPAQTRNRWWPACSTSRWPAVEQLHTPCPVKFSGLEYDNVVALDISTRPASVLPGCTASLWSA